MSVSPCGCQMKAQDWSLPCDIEETNGLRCGSDPDGNQVVWVPPDDGVLLFTATPTIKSHFRTSLGARFNTEDMWENYLGEGDETTTELSQSVYVEFENTTCHTYLAQCNFSMGLSVFQIGNGTSAYVGMHNEIDVDGTTLVDTTPLSGMAFSPDGVSSHAALGQSIGDNNALGTTFMPPTTWPVYETVEPGQTLTATITGIGGMDRWGSGGEETVEARFGWVLNVVCWPEGIDS